MKLTFKVYGKTWADETAASARRRVPVRTGRLKASIRRRNATQKRATVVAHYSANFVDAGTKEHDIKPRKAKRLVFDSGGNTIFARKVHKRRIAARPFKSKAAHEALTKHPMKETMIELWNSGA